MVSTNFCKGFETKTCEEIDRELEQIGKGFVGVHALEPFFLVSFPLRQTTLLHEAVLAQNLNAVNQLLASGFDTSLVNGNGSAPLHLSVRFCGRNIFDALTKIVSTNVWSIDHLGRTAKESVLSETSVGEYAKKVLMDQEETCLSVVSRELDSVLSVKVLSLLVLAFLVPGFSFVSVL